MSYDKVEYHVVDRRMPCAIGNSMWKETCDDNKTLNSGKTYLGGCTLPLLFDLFFTFAKIGLFTFGGGYAMLSLIENTCVEEKKWISHDEMINLAVIAESTPGPIAINCATYVGYRQGKIVGAIIATLGMVLPSFIIIYVISGFLDHFLEMKLVANAFQGIKIAVGILIIDAALKMLHKMKKKPMQIVIVVCTTIAMIIISAFSLRISSMLLMVVAAMIGLAVFFITEKQGRRPVNDGLS